MNDTPATLEVLRLESEQDLASVRKQREQFDRNSEWLQKNVTEVYAAHRGKCVCVAGCELFVGDTTSQAISQALAAHPDEEGWFTRYIPREKVARVYANQR